MRKKLLATTLLSAFLLTLSPTPQALATDTVQVTLPSFSVTLNGQTTGNDYSKYPLLVYKDITYFPMTYYDCRLLGLKTDWTADTGLVIDKNEGYFYEYLREVNNSKNARKQTARIADGKITVNGKVIDNSKEEYPLLVFRDVTYFPLTWRFAVNEFGWDYRFNQQEGLVIDNDKVKLKNPEKWHLNDDITVKTKDRPGLSIYIESYQNPRLYGDSRIKIVRTWKELENYRNTLKKLNHGKLLSVEELRNISQNLEDYIDVSDLSAVSDFCTLDNNLTVHILWESCSPAQKFVDACMEYQIHKQVGNHEELVYRYLLPPFNGDRHYYAASYGFTTGFLLQKNLSTGTYKVSMQHPDYFNYYDSEDNTLRMFPLNGSDLRNFDAHFEEFEFQIIE